MENKRTETNKTVQKRLEPELKLINMDTVEVEQIEWLLCEEGLLERKMEGRKAVFIIQRKK